MYGFTTILVNDQLAIKWDDETLIEAIERARAEQSQEVARG